MKVLVIPDVHGSHEWEAARRSGPADYDYVVFLGDYFDSWENEWPDQGENFRKICAFVREDTEHRKLLLGNHDWSYLSRTKYGSGVSGHQNSHIDEIRTLLSENHDIMDIAFECKADCQGGRVVFSHAGFSRTWVNSFRDVFGIPEEEWSVSFLNEQWHKLSFDPKDENFNYAFEEILDWHGFFSGSGNEITQGPLWIRPEALLKDAFYETQLVGHTEYCLGDFIILSEKDATVDRKNTLIASDSSKHLLFDVIDTECLSEWLQENTISLQGFNRFYKHTMKKILDIKSREFAAADYSKESALKNLSEAFGEKLSKRYYRMFFES